jgi:hypothetical protein
MILFKTIIAAAKALSALYERSVFSYRGNSLRNRLNQEWPSSTIHLRALKVGSFSINFFSSPRGRIWGMNPLSTTTSSFPTYAASRQRFWGVAPSFGLRILPFNNGSKEILSCRLAPVTTNDKGTPRSSTRRLRFVPFFSPIRGIRSDRFLRKRCFNIRAISSLPKPGNPFQFIVFNQASPPDILKHSCRGPLLELAVDRSRSKTFKLFSWQSIPDDTRTQHIYDSGKIQPV